MTRLALAALLLIALRPAHAQLNPHAPISLHAQLNMDTTVKQKAYVFYAAEPQTVPAGKRATLDLRFHMQPGYHVNSHTPRSELLIKTTLTLQPAAGVKGGPLVYPAGQPYSFSFDPSDELDVYASDFIIRLPVVAAAGQHTVDGSLLYQACDHASCYPPRTLPVELIFTAK